jgi:hypothetical protein
VARHLEHVEAWRGLWERKGTLWTEAVLARIERDIRDAVNAELGGFADRVELPIETVEAEEGGPGEDWVGCPDGASLEEIGIEFEVCRERARQMLLRALSSFARSWKRLYPRDPLVSLLFDDEDRAGAIVKMAEIDAALARTSEPDPFADWKAA